MGNARELRLWVPALGLTSKAGMTAGVGCKSGAYCALRGFHPRGEPRLPSDLF